LGMNEGVGDMSGEIKRALTANSIPRSLQRFVRCKICKKKASTFFVTSRGGFVLFCEPCLQTLNVLYKREIRQRAEGDTILEDD
jgi:translation initiation factor 2 beta subunit (eIF-2beta)/eIF-5